MKAAIFDMDGTMVDNMMVHHAAWQQILLDNGLDMTLEEVKESIHGINVEILARLFGEQLSAEDRIRISSEKEQRYRDIFADRLTLIPGLETFLQELFQAKIPMAIASAAPQENVDFVLDGLQLRAMFPVVFHAADVQFGKPHPEIYLKTAAALKQPTSNCVVFEDSPTGAQSASSAGCEVIVVTTTHEAREFEHIDGILAFIKDFTGFSLAKLGSNHA